MVVAELVLALLDRSVLLGCVVFLVAPPTDNVRVMVVEAPALVRVANV